MSSGMKDCPAPLLWRIIRSPFGPGRTIEVDVGSVETFSSLFGTFSRPSKSLTIRPPTSSPTLPSRKVGMPSRARATPVLPTTPPRLKTMEETPVFRPGRKEKSPPGTGIGSMSSTSEPATTTFFMLLLPFSRPTIQ